MKTMKIGKKEYIVVEKDELDKIIRAIDRKFAECEFTALCFDKVAETQPDRSHDFMTWISEYANEGRELISKSFPKEV